jgi:acetolactate synthase-1/2/3 large subunit
VSGKGTFPESHPLALGPYGAWGIPAANAGVADADLLLVVGSRLAATDTAMAHPGLIDPTRQTLIQLDVEPKNAGWTFPVDHALVGELKTVLAQLTDEVAGETPKSAGEERVTTFREQKGYFDGPEYEDTSSPSVPQRIVRELNKALPSNSIVTCDAGENRVFVSCFYETPEAQGLLQSGNGCMGYAIPSAIAAKLVNPDRPVVAVCGDGGFAMTMNGLLTTVTDDIPIVVVIMNNHYLGESMHGRNLAFGTEMGNFNYAGIAESMGARGIHVDSPDELGPALAEALAESRATVIDVEMSSEFSYLQLAAQLEK